MSRVVLIVGGFALILALVLAACAPPATPTLAPEATPTPPPEATPTPPQEPTPTPKEEITRGGIMTMGFSEVPGGLPNLNPYTGVGFGIYHPWQMPVLQGLLEWDPDGNAVSVLAVEVPTLDNGGVSGDGKTITYRLRPNVKWADGEPFTCDDVRFTLEALHNPDNILHSHEGSEFVEEVQCPDDLTAVFKFREPYAAWQMVPEFILPEHILSQYPDMNDVPWNNEMFGTGPFIVTEIVPGDHIIYEPNPHYWEEGKPYLDKFIMVFIEDVSAGLERFKAGEIDAYYYVFAEDLPEVRTIPEYTLVKPQGNAYMYLYLNLSASSGPNMGNPDYPNPVLADVRVRRAVDMAMDKLGICDTFQVGESFPVASLHFVGLFNPGLEPSRYDPEGAKRLLEEAGWVDTDSDGVRECHGCMYANEGDLASLKIVTCTEWKTQCLLTMQYVQENLQDVGFAVTLESSPMGLLWAPAEAGGIMCSGSFDIAWCGDRAPRDPQGQLERDFHSKNAYCPGSFCMNWSRYRNPEFDALLEQAGHEMNFEARKEMLDTLFKMVKDDLPIIYIHSQSRMAIVQAYIKGMNGPYDKANGFLWATNYIQHVHIEK